MDLRVVGDEGLVLVLQQKDLRQTPTSLKGKQFRRAVETLPEEQKEAVMLAYFGGFTHPEIAERTGVPLGTVKGRLRLAMQKLRGLLADVDTGGPHQ
jgi:RNA polymerase sigma-70 factor, ECF subfamily